MHHLIKAALFALGSVAAYLVYAFTVAVAPWWVAAGAAGSLVATYVGLAYARIPPHQQQRARRVARGAATVEAAYGTLYTLSVLAPEVFAPPLSLWLAVPLAVLHGAAFSVLAYFVSIFVVYEDAAVEAPPAPQPLTIEVKLPEWAALPAQPSYPTPARVDATPIATRVDAHVSDGLEPVGAVADCVCRYCGAAGLTASERMVHGRRHKRHGTCVSKGEVG